MNSENIITIAGIGIFTTWMIALVVMAFWKSETYERENRQAIKRGNQHQENELRGQGRLLIASNSLTRGE